MYVQGWMNSEYGIIWVFYGFLGKYSVFVLGCFLDLYVVNNVFVIMGMNWVDILE